MELWRRIETWDAPPAFNMGLDEALLELGPDRPTLRFYTWRPDAISLGYFQRLADVPAAARAGALVRRITGGGAIHHAGELTFSIAAPAAHPLYAGPVAGSYERVHGVIARALARAGVDAAPRGDAALSSDVAGTGLCFHHSTPADLAWNGAKGVGSAQRRKGRRVLHHGSIKLVPSPTEGGIATVAGSGRAIEPREMAELLLEALRDALGVETEPAAPTEEELLHAYRRGPAYASPGFVGRR